MGWIMDTQIFFSVLVVCLVILLIFFIGLIYYCIKIRMEVSRKAVSKKRAENKEQKSEALRKRRRIFGEVFVLVLVLVSCLLYKRNEYRIMDDFYSQKQYDRSVDETLAQIFEKKARKYIDEVDRVYEAVHMDIYDDVFGDGHDGINENDIEQYQEKIGSIYQEMPYKDDLIKEAEEEMLEEYDEILKTFKEAVDADISTWKPDDLWEAYEAGRELSKKNNTSEMVFQTAVLAEGAHENSYKISRDDSNTRLYLAGTTESFEEFLDFNTRNSGAGTIVSELEVCYRQGKMDYREGIKEKERNNPEARHFLLKTYTEVQYARDHTAVENKNYLSYLYYCSLACLRLVSYIEDKELRLAMCNKELEKWDYFLERNNGSLGGQEVEDKTEKDIYDAYDKLLDCMKSDH